MSSLYYIYQGLVLTVDRWLFYYNHIELFPASFLVTSFQMPETGTKHQFEKSFYERQMLLKREWEWGMGN